MRELQEIGTTLICPAAAVIRGNCLLVGLRHYTPDKWKTISVWTTPGGRCDAGEKVGDALRREAAEEVGITDLEITDFIGTVVGAKEGDVVPIFACRTGQEPRLLEPQKFSEWKWMDINQMPSNFINRAELELIAGFIRNHALSPGMSRS